MPAATWTGARVLWTGVLLPPKKGRVRWPNQAGQGHEVDGGDRRPRCSSGKAPGVGLASGSEVAPPHAGNSTRAARGPRSARRSRLRRVIADKAYDSDPARRELQRWGGELICPHRKNRRRPALHDGRPLRRYRKRWKVERTFAWLGITAAGWSAMNTKSKCIQPFFTSPAGSSRSGIYETTSTQMSQLHRPFF